jgi:hypothetical protein
MEIMKDLQYALSTDNGIVTLKLGYFYEQLDTIEKHILHRVIWGLYRDAKSKFSESINMSVVFHTPSRHRQRVVAKLEALTLDYVEYTPDMAPTPQHRGWVSRVFRLEPIIYQVSCNHEAEVAKILQDFWPLYRLFFRLYEPEKMNLGADYSAWEEAEMLRCVPEELLERNLVVIAEFFHGLWIEIKTKRYHKEDIEHLIMGETNVLSNLEIHQTLDL